MLCQGMAICYQTCVRVRVHVCMCIFDVQKCLINVLVPENFDYAKVFGI